MAVRTFQWDDGVDGSLLVETPERIVIRTTSELSNHVHYNYKLLGPQQLEILGALWLFIAIREYGAGPPPGVLLRAEKALDSFGPGVVSPEHDKRLWAGMDGLREHLFPFSSRAYQEIVEAAFEYISKKLDSGPR